MKGSRYLVVCLLLLPPVQARAQTLSEVLELARRHAPALAVAEANESRAAQAIREARAALSPSLRLNANFVQNSEGQKVVFALPGSPTRQTISFGSASVLDVRTVADYTLYSGGRNGALVRAAEAAREGQRRERSRAEADLAFRVSQAFYRVLAAQRLQTAAMEASASARAHRVTSAARVRAGVVSRLDSLQAQVDVTRRTTGVVRAEQAVRTARVELESTIGVTLDTTRTLVEPESPTGDVPEAAEATAQALRERPELATLDQALRENQARLEAARAGHRPQVNLSATAQYLGPNRDEDWWNPDEPGLRTHKFFAGLGLTVPLYDAGLVDARVGEVAAERAALEARRRDAELGVRREVEQAISDVRVALAVWQSNRSRLAASREALRIAEAGYRGGTASGTDVRDAEAAVADARAEEAQSLMDYWTARASLDHATGAMARKEP